MSTAPFAPWPELRTLFFCIGAQKAATTWLAETLAAAPDVHVARCKEMHFWNAIGADAARRTSKARRRRAGALRDAMRNIGSPQAALADLREARMYHDRLRLRQSLSVPDYARTLMRGWRGQPVAGEATPNYDGLPVETYQRMADLHPRTRFVFVMRDPVDRLWSGLRHKGRRDAAVAGDLNGALAQALDDPDDAHVRRGDYADVIDRVERGVGADRVSYYFYETLRADAEMARLADFLDVAPIRFDPDQRVNVGSVGIRPDATLWSRARTRYAKTYDYVADRFGGAVPGNWNPA